MWCLGSDSNRHALWAADFESAASTDFATQASNLCSALYGKKCAMQVEKIYNQAVWFKTKHSIKFLQISYAHNLWISEWVTKKMAD